MNDSNIRPPFAAANPLIDNLTETLEARFAYRVAARLDESAAHADVSERLRFAREKALERARAARSASAPVTIKAGRSAALLFGGFGSWGLKLASALPVVALVAGLVLIKHQHDDAQITAAAQIDAELLGDDLPPSAYADNDFAEFLKTSANARDRANNGRD